MSIGERSSAETQKRLKERKLTEKEIKELMGVKRETYKRHRGAIRRK